MSVSLPLVMMVSSIVCAAPALPPIESEVFFPNQPSFGVVTHTSFNGAEMKALGMSWVRRDISWRDVEPKIKGQYDFSGYDKPIDHYRSHGLNQLIMLPLEGMSELYPAPNKEFDMIVSAYAGYARACAERYKGKVQIFELGNEPEVFTVGDVFNDPAKYTKIARAAAKAIREVDANVHVAALSVGWMDRPFILGAFQRGLLADGTIDVISFHGYNRETVMPEGKLREDITWLRQQIARYAPKGKKIIVIDSERGYSIQPFLQPKAWDSWKNNLYSETEQAAYCARHFLTEMACGVEISIWYKDMSGESGFSFYEGPASSRLRPMGYVMRNLAPLFDTNPKQMINRQYRISLVDLKDDIPDPNASIRIESFLKKTATGQTLIIALWNPVEAFDGKILHSRQQIGDRYYEAWRAISPNDKVNIPVQVNIHGIAAQAKVTAFTHDLLANDPKQNAKSLSVSSTENAAVTDRLEIGPMPTIISVAIPNK